MNIFQNLSIINNSVITIKDFQPTNPSFDAQAQISQLSQEEATRFLNSLEQLPNYVSEFLATATGANVELQLGNDFLNLNFLGEIDSLRMLENLSHSLGLRKISDSLSVFPILNPSLHVKGVEPHNLSYQITIPDVNPGDILRLFNYLGGISLPDAFKWQLKSLENVALILTNSVICLQFVNDIQLDLDEIFNLDTSGPYMGMAIDGIISGIFGKSELSISTPKFGFFKETQGVELSLKGLLNSQNLELTFNDRITLNYKLPNDIAFGCLTGGIPIINSLKLINPELIITNLSHSFTHSELGQINLSKGFNFIGNTDFTNLDTNFANFIHSQLGVDCLKVYISFDPVGSVSLTGNIQRNILLYSINNFSATFSHLVIGLDIGTDLEPNFGVTGNLAIQGYDPTQNDEPVLFLAGKLSLEPESITACFYQQGKNSWCNPYGLVGTEFRNIGFQGGGTYLPPYFDNFGFIGDLKWQEIDLEVAFLMDTNDPERLAFILTTNQPVNLVDLWQGPIASVILKQASSSINLVNKALAFLNTFLDLNIESIDRHGDGKLDPLVKYVLFPATIAGQPISEGLEINGKMTAWGREATLTLQGDRTFSKVEGSLNVPEIDLGFLKIGGTNDDCLDLALNVTPNEQYLMGDGYVKLLDNEIANVEFQITPTSAIFKNFDLSLANLVAIDVNTLSIELKSGSGSGTGTILVLGNTLADSTFDVTRDSVTLKNTKLNLAGFLTIDIPTLTVSLKNQSASGTGKIAAFNQSLGSGTLSFNPQKVTIDNVSLGLGDVLKLNVPSFKLDLTNKKVFGIGDITLLGKQFTSSGISLNESGFQANSNFNFGILAFSGATVTLNKKTNGNIDNSASIAGNLKFLGYNFANVTASVNSSKLTVSGSFNFGGLFILKGANNKKNATITINKAKNKLYSSVRIAGSFYVLGKELTSIAVSDTIKKLKFFGIKIIGKADKN
ncbi:hypothetical protein [Scytonema sp. NUACC26]|uniref:hypothetical protein n=1 Tax=Scytonema sp. NUACC26 TaxID=3140176 RepID=UPI0034DC3A23